MSNEQLKTYFAEAASWDIDRAGQTAQRMRIAWLVAGAGWVGSLCLCAALMLLMPLKSTEPYVIRVDNSTGIVDIVPVYAGHAEISQTVARYLLSHYITVCESFDPSTAERDYEECGAYHTAKRNQDWWALWNPVNPKSPLNLYKDGTTVRSQVTALTFFTRHDGVNSLAQVRYVKAKRPQGVGTEVLTHWIATIEYAYATPSHDVKVRQWNPLGFRIVDFQTEPESVADTTTIPGPTPRGTPQ
jgi:type IV secretion system protein VirB8